MIDVARRAVELGLRHRREDLDSDDLLGLALTRLIEVLGEAAKGVSPETRLQYADIPWRRITGTRDRLIHAYFDLDLDMLWEVVVKDLPPVLPQLEAALRDLDGTGD